MRRRANSPRPTPLVAGAYDAICTAPISRWQPDSSTEGTGSLRRLALHNPDTVFIFFVTLEK
ncbi:hypothetical protein IF1G_01356 [Cordyceps javanica]|uniref:Uncharacterized protein n=1 Tax=Cordyceps javanica TaxID=43265 RepID=A0A545VBM9_9HYPO|nr:hypothetical protein IF1G_01356 [Cordyceps javanica]